MKLNQLKPINALNKAFLKVKVTRDEIEKFKSQFALLLESINENESEEYHKNLVSGFLKKTYYDPAYFINTKGRNDLVIHSGKNAKTAVGVIIEAKKPGSRYEMLRHDSLNVKAFHELILYYLRERIRGNNSEIRHLIATDIYEWFIFDAEVFEKAFFQNKYLVKKFRDFEEKKLPENTTDYFYREIARPAIEETEAEIEFTCFDIREYEKLLKSEDKEDANRLIRLFKLLSPEHLLKLPFANDSNTLDRSFYSELLHIMGLTETEEGGKKLIERKKEEERNPGSLLENIITELENRNKTEPEILFDAGLELVITWMNRLLFLKLLEAQLLTYHKGDRAYFFLNYNKIKDFSVLNSLFFDVLAKTTDSRNEDVKQAFEKVPYLNSSLFEITELEQKTFPVSGLDSGKRLPLFSSTVLKDKNGKKLTGELNTLEYIFRFLDSYNFAGEGTEEIQEERKTLISASVLGLIFEKINGYKDGSFFTPGFITMYMCRETIRRAVVQKFNEKKGWNCKGFDELYDKIEDRKEADEIVNSLKICDPAVGSGHFLVSALNEIIAVKSELKILQDRKGKRLKEYRTQVVNDELIVTDEDGEFFEYRPGDCESESQRVQETLFHEKQIIIENCLFGEDINRNSVKICRLRLWIELLKNAYYKENHELETLPNIDINIKCGNSLISRFALNDNLKKALKKSKWNIDSYRTAVRTYRRIRSKKEKDDLKKLIEEIKKEFRSELGGNNPKLKKLNKLRGDLYDLATRQTLVEESAKDKKAKEQKQKKLEKEIAGLNAEIEESQSGGIYDNAVEWRFEFPEVLNDDGKFIGFDVVIGNPPYIRQEEFSAVKPYLQQRFQIYNSISDLLTYFVELGYDLLKDNGIFQFIVSNKFTRANYGKQMRKFLSDKTAVTHFIDFSGLPVFDEATVDAAIVGFEKRKTDNNTLIYTKIPKTGFDINNFSGNLNLIKQDFLQSGLTEQAWAFESSEVLRIKQKAESQGTPLKDWDISINFGIKTGYNRAFVVDGKKRAELIAQDQKSAEILKPLLRGRDVHKYYSDFQDLWLINLHNGYRKDGEHIPALKAEDYPAVKKHLDQFFKELDKRTDKGKTPYNLRNCTYIEAFEKPKIIYRDISQVLTFTLDYECFYTNNTIYFITGDFDLQYLLATLNSKLFDFYYRLISTQLGSSAVRLFNQFVEQIPVKQITKKQEKPFKERASKILAAKKQDPHADTGALEKEIDRLVYELYGLTEEEIAVVEKGI